MKAIILTAGEGKRLLPLTKEIPKGMLKIGNKTILERTISTLNEYGINDITLIVGHGAEKIKKLFGNKVKYIYNPLYKTTNNIYSFWVATEEINNDCLCIHGDILFHKNILGDILRHKGDICLAVQEKDKREMIRVKVKNSLITEINKPIPFKEAYGNFIGIAKYSKRITKTLIKITRKYIEEAKLDVYYTAPINDLIKEGIKVHPIKVSIPWCDIDDKEDLKFAEKISLWLQ